MLNRLLHDANIVQIRGDSYRLKDEREPGCLRGDTECIAAPGERPSVSESRAGASRRTNGTRIFR